MIEVKGISKKFGRLQALNHVNLQCHKGQCIALIGPNGCGKTTLIKTILNMVIPDEGAIYFNEKDIRGDHFYRSHIGYMPQIGRYPENMTVGQVLETIQVLRNTKEATDEELYYEFKIGDILGKRMSSLSGGTRQKVSAILAFMFNPQVMILDEPTAGLDPLAAEILKEKMLADMKKDKLILITSHMLSELDDVVSEVVFMGDGIVRFHKSTELLKQETESSTISKAISTLLRARHL